MQRGQFPTTILTSPLSNYSGDTWGPRIRACTSAGGRRNIVHLTRTSPSAVTRDIFDQVMSEEPLFDVTLKKKKKKVVNFNEDPLGADGGAPAPTYVCSERVARPGRGTLNAWT